MESIKKQLELSESELSERKAHRDYIRSLEPVFLPISVGILIFLLMTVDQSYYLSWGLCLSALLSAVIINAVLISKVFVLRYSPQILENARTLVNLTASSTFFLAGGGAESNLWIIFGVASLNQIYIFSVIDKMKFPFLTFSGPCLYLLCYVYTADLHHLQSGAFIFPFILMLGIVLIGKGLVQHLLNSKKMIKDKKAQDIYMRELEQAYKTLKNTQEKLVSTQSQLVQAAKLTSLGTMASGVAHELNNPLAGVQGYANLIKKTEKLTPQGNQMLEKLVVNTHRMANIIDHLRSFARESTTEDIKPIDLKQVVLQAFDLLGVQLNLRSIQYYIHADGDSYNVLGDSNQLESVFQNLITNSRDAFESVTDGRRKEIHTTLEVDQNRTVNITYSDNASGIPYDIQSKVFDPFFSTKPVGKGTGLGLSISLGIIKDHDGSIQVKSAPEEGTEFKMRIPYCELAIEEPKLDASGEEVRSTVRDPSQKPKVLLVDDEEDICKILSRCLADDFEVQAFQDPRKALNEMRRKRFDLIISDISMPFLSGRDIVRSAQKIQPNTPVILITGHGEEESIVKEAKSLKIAGLLPKPFPEIDEIVKIIWREIEASQK